MTIFSTTEIEHVKSIVIRCMMFRHTDSEIIEEMQKEYPGKHISKSTISRLKKQVKHDYLGHYKNIRKNKELFVYYVMEKYNAIDYIIKEYRNLYIKVGTSDNIKLKILEKLILLDRYQLSMLQDLPYLLQYHSDVKLEIRKLGNEIRSLEQSSNSNLNINEENNRDQRLSVDSCDISNIDPEIRKILMNRSESGLERYITKVN